MSSLTIGLLVLAAVSTAYWLVASWCAARFRRRPPHRASPSMPRVTVLKPVRSAGGHLYERLRSFCEQDYADYQIVVGVRDADDPAIGVVSRLMAEYPHLDLQLVVSDRVVGANPKVSNLANLYEAAKHDILVVADSDIHVGPDYLRTVVAPLEDPEVGLASCLYRGVSDRGLWATLGAMFINEWFFPSVLVGARLEGVRYAFGATMVCRRQTLERVGGFAALAPYLADDYQLGRLVAADGGRVIIVPYVVDTSVTARTLRELFVHELRWARTYRTLRPLGYFFSVVTLALPVCALGLLAVEAAPAAVVGTLVLAAARFGVTAVVARALDLPLSPQHLCLVPVRDTLSLAIWAASFLGRTVQWAGQRFRVDRQGKMMRLDQSSESLTLAPEEIA
jgi:ceramide glucosyltransferase